VEHLTYNPAASKLLKQYPHLYQNTCACAIDLIEEHLENPNMDWKALSANPCAVHLLERYPEKINWSKLSSNPSAIHLLERNQDKIDWYELSSNPMHLMKVDKLQVFSGLSKNPGIFGYNYPPLRDSRAVMHRELLARCYRV
jgi:hypothetical protein